MPKKNKITPASKPKKTDKLLYDEIDKIIKVTEDQNTALKKILLEKTK